MIATTIVTAATLAAPAQPAPECAPPLDIKPLIRREYRQRRAPSRADRRRIKRRIDCLQPKQRVRARRYQARWRTRQHFTIAFRRFSPPIRRHLRVIAACESDGNPRAVSSSGTYRGKYQFSLSTWRSVGGHGDPAAAIEPEQDYRAARLYRSAGPGQWPVCGA